MTLARAWTRHLFGASGVALLAPATMIAALAILALGGGFGGFGALGQLISGPAVPVGSPVIGAQVAPRTTQPLLPVVPASLASGRAPTRVGSAPAPAGSRTGGTTGGGTPAGRGGGGAQRVGSGGHGRTPPVAPPPAQTPPPVTPPAAAPSAGPVHALVNTVVGVGVSVTSQLPAPVGAIGTSALESVGQTLSTLLAPLP